MTAIVPGLPRGTTRTDLGPSVFFDFVTSGTGDGAPDTNTTVLFNLEVTSDDIAQDTNQPLSGFGIGNAVRLEHHYGGAAMKGVRNTFQIESFFDGGASDPTNPTRFYCGLASYWYGMSNDGGSEGDAKGAGFGGSSIARLTADATYFANLSAHEFDIITDPSDDPLVDYLAGIMVVGLLGRNGETHDCAIAVSGLGTGAGDPHIGFETGFLIGDMNGAVALKTTSTLMKVINHPTLDIGLDFTDTAFTTAVVSANGFVIAAPDGNHSIEMGRTDGTLSTPFIDFHSGATPVDYDARLLASGGDGTIGHGSLNVYGAGFSVQGLEADNVPFTVNALVAQSAPLVDLQVNSVAKFQVEATGRVRTVSGNETTGAGSALLGANSPAVTNTAPYKWLRFTTSDGSDVYVPAWK